MTNPLAGSAGPATSGIWRMPLDAALSTPAPVCHVGRLLMTLTPPPVPAPDNGFSQPASSRYVRSVRRDRSVPPTLTTDGLLAGHDWLTLEFVTSCRRAQYAPLSPLATKIVMPCACAARWKA